MKFKKSFLRFEEWDETIYDRIVGHRRWSVDHEVVFKQDGHYYHTGYSVGATEGQDERPYEYEPDEIECPEVWPHEKVVTVYMETQ